MKPGKTARKAAYVGAGAGLALFAMIGFHPGLFLGGAVGIKIAGGLFGLPLEANILPRLIVAVSMVLGVLTSGCVFIACGATTGWIIGSAIDALKTLRPARAYFTGRGKTKKGEGGDSGQRASD